MVYFGVSLFVEILKKEPSYMEGFDDENGAWQQKFNKTITFYKIGNIFVELEDKEDGIIKK